MKLAWKPVLRVLGVPYCSHNGIQRWNRMKTFRVGAIVVVLALLTASFAHAQISRFIFDASGNLSAKRADIVSPPQIIGQPQNQTVAPGGTAAFSVVAANTRQLSYQWLFRRAIIGSGINESILREDVNANDEGEYRVVLTNPSGSVTSAPAFLMLDSDADGLGDTWEAGYFTNLNATATADLDGDGVSNRQEFLDGTDPTNRSSARYRLLVLRDGGSVIKSVDQTSYTNGESITLTAVSTPGNEPFHAWLGDIVTRSNPVTLVMTNDKMVYARFTPIEFTWTNSLSGDWDVATNWTPNLAPGVNDTAIIDRSGQPTVTLNSTADCDHVSLGGFNSSPTLTGTGTLKVRGNLSWLSGAMSGSGHTIVEAGGELNMGNPSLLVLNGRTLENAGTALWTDMGSISMNFGAVITNRTGASFQIQGGGTFSAPGGSSRFDNAGTFVKAVAGTLLIPGGVSFNNSGVVEIQAGTFGLAGGGTSSGTFNAPATTVVEWTAGTFTLNPGAQLHGDGLYRINAGTVAANANLAIEKLDLISGTLGGTGAVTILSQMNWTGGGMSGSGLTIIPAGATLNAALPVGAGLNARTLENAGTVLWTGAGNIGFVSAVITNRAGALFQAQGAGGMTFVSGLNRFDNAGTFRKSVHAGTLEIVDFPRSGSFNNYGAVEIQTGTLLCAASFNNQGAVNLSSASTNRLAGGGSATGTFTTPTTALVEWTGGTFTLNPGAQLNGAGLYRINGISAHVVGDADVTVQNFDLVNGSSTLSGTGVLTIANVMNWTAGAMGGSGRTIIPSGATLLVGSSSGTGLQRTLENGGTVLWTGAGTLGFLNGVITNRAGALFHAQNDARLFYAGGVGRFDNAGTFRKSVGNGTTEIGVSFANHGTVDIRSGILAANGGYSSTSNALLNCALGGTTAGTNYGQLQVAGVVTLNGGLSVELINGFLPATNVSFTVLTAGTRNGTFASFSHPSNVVAMQLSNTPNSVIVRATGLAVPELVLFPPVISGSNVTVCWVADSNKTYQLEFSTNLGPTNWFAVPGQVITSSNQACISDALTSSNRFYRVRVLP